MKAHFSGSACEAYQQEFEEGLPHACNQCDRRFGSAGKLGLHVDQKHNNNVRRHGGRSVALKAETAPTPTQGGSSRKRRVSADTLDTKVVKKNASVVDYTSDEEDSEEE